MKTDHSLGAVRCFRGFQIKASTYAFNAALTTQQIFAIVERTRFIFSLIPADAACVSVYFDSARRLIRRGWGALCTQTIAIRVGRHWLQRRIDSDRPSPFLKKQRSVCVCQLTSSVCWFQQQPEGGHLFSSKEDVLPEAIPAPSQQQICLPMPKWVFPFSSLKMTNITLGWRLCLIIKHAGEHLRVAKRQPPPFLFFSFFYL